MRQARRAQGRSELLYGRNAVREALRGRRSIHRLLMVDGSQNQPRLVDIIEAARERDIKVELVPRVELDRRLGPVNHQGVAVEAGPFRYTELERILSAGTGRPLLFLDQIQDPQNLGTLLRSAEAFGVAGIIIPERRSAEVTPAVVNSSSGAVEHVRVARAVNLGRALEQARDASYWVVGLEAGPGSIPIFDAAIPTPTALLIGSEGRGLGPTLLSRCDIVVSLPMLGRVESLNAAVAGSIALFELLRRGPQQDDTD